MHLLCGQWLRRTKRRRDALPPNKPGSDPRTAELDLTPRKRVANLAASGATNNQIAEQLFLSPSTVDYDLGKVEHRARATAQWAWQTRQVALGARQLTWSAGLESSSLVSRLGHG